MQALPSSSFIFAVCQIGAENALKNEVNREHPELRFAYSRPGFVTFKSVSRPLTADFVLRSVFARAYGLSAAQADDDEGVLAFSRELSESHSPLRLHCWEKDRFSPGESPPDLIPQARAIALEEKLLTEGPFFEGSQASAGDLVLDVILMDEGMIWMGVHQHGKSHSPHPGGDPRIKLPPDAPSRAYTKLAEGIAWAGADLKPGQIAVEVGSAPGGASWYLLQKGLKVIGIDPAEMDPRVMAHPHFKHLRASITDITRADLPERLDWVLLDMNVPPQVAFPPLEDLVASAGDSLQGLFLTFKLNRWRIANEIPSMLERLRALGMQDVRATQLASNKQEIFVSAFAYRD